MKKRLRKKLHKGEFTQLDFHVWFDYSGVTGDVLDDLIDFVEEQGLMFGGGLGHGSCDGCIARWKGSTSEKDKQLVEGWLSSRSDISNVGFGPLFDGWHGECGCCKCEADRGKI